MKDVREAVREKYGELAKGKGACCAPSALCCAGTNASERLSVGVGYSENELRSVPKDANLGLGCGNPTVLASLREGEVVLDLGSGGGLDCFLAAEKVGKEGKVIGVDMTPEMVHLARRNAVDGGRTNVEFRLGEIEHLPVADRSVDVALSNCVINLSPDKRKVFQELYRVLKPGGRFMISDIVLLKPLPDYVRESIDAYVGCIAGALVMDDYLGAVTSAGFKDVRVRDEKRFLMVTDATDPFIKSLMEKFDVSAEEVKDVSASIVSIHVEGTK